MSQEVDSPHNNDMATSDQMDCEEVDILGNDEGEDDIVFIEEEYKSIVDESEKSKHKISRADFTFLKMIGSGAHAKVYLARKIDTKQLYAIKVLDKRELTKKKQVSGTMVERKILVDLNLSHLQI